MSNRTLEASNISDGEGALTIGGLPASDHFTGVLQDVRVYQASLTDRSVELHTLLELEYYSYYCNNKTPIFSPNILRIVNNTDNT